MNRGFGINFLDEDEAPNRDHAGVMQCMGYPNPFHQWSMLRNLDKKGTKISGFTLHISCTKCLPVFCWFNPHQDIQQKKTKPIKTVVGPNSPRSFGGKKNKSPCLFGPKCQKSPRFLPGGRHQGRVQGMSHAPNRLVSGRTCLGTSTKPLEFGSEILDKTQVTTSEHRLKMRNKWKNMEKWGGDSSFQITWIVTACTRPGYGQDARRNVLNKDVDTPSPQACCPQRSGQFSRNRVGMSPTRNYPLVNSHITMGNHHV